MSKKGENIYKRKDNRWEARFVKGYKIDGKPKYGYCYGKTYTEAKKKLIEAKANIIEGKPSTTTVHKKRLVHFCDEWLLINRNHIKESTYVKYHSILEKYIKPRLGGCFINALSSVIIEQFSHDLLIQDDLSPKTVKDILTLLNSIIKYISKQTSLSMQLIDIVYPKIPKSEIRFLSREEQTKFVEYLLNDIDECKFGVLLSLFTGMRIGEICALQWGNISLSENTVKVQSTMQRIQDFNDNHTNKTKVIISEPKSEMSARVIPLTDCAAKLCKAYFCPDPSAFVLTGESDRYIEPRLLQHKLKKYTEDCGLKDVHFHTLRHTFATRCVEVNFEIKSLSEILGHSSPKITLERYIHSSIELKRDNMSKLSAIGF